MSFDPSISSRHQRGEEGRSPQAEERKGPNRRELQLARMFQEVQVDLQKRTDALGALLNSFNTLSDTFETLSGDEKKEATKQVAKRIFGDKPGEIIQNEDLEPQERKELSLPCFGALLYLRRLLNLPSFSKDSYLTFEPLSDLLKNALKEVGLSEEDQETLFSQLEKISSSKERADICQRHPKLKEGFLAENATKLLAGFPQLFNLTVETIFILGEEADRSQSFLNACIQIGILPCRDPETPFHVKAADLFLSWICAAGMISDSAAAAGLRVWSQIEENTPVEEALWNAWEEQLTPEQRVVLPAWKTVVQKLTQPWVGTIRPAQFSAEKIALQKPFSPLGEDLEPNAYSLLGQKQLEMCFAKTEPLLEHLKWTIGCGIKGICRAAKKHTKKTGSSYYVVDEKKTKENFLHRPETESVGELEKALESFHFLAKKRFALLKTHVQQCKNYGQGSDLKALLLLESSYKWLIKVLQPLQRKMSTSSLLFGNTSQELQKQIAKWNRETEKTLRAAGTSAEELVQRYREMEKLLEEVPKVVQETKSLYEALLQRIRSVKKRLPAIVETTAPPNLETLLIELQENEEVETPASSPQIDIALEEDAQSEEDLPPSTAPASPPVSRVPEQVEREFLPQLASTVQEWLSSGSGSTAAREEIACHLLLAGQNLEMLSELPENLREVCIHAHLLHLHVALEQWLGSQIENRPPPVHSLLHLAQLSKIDLTPEIREFFAFYDRAILWTRYPNAYSIAFANRQTNDALSQFLSETPHHETVLEKAEKDYQTLLTLILGKAVPLPAKNLREKTIPYQAGKEYSKLRKGLETSLESSLIVDAMVEGSPITSLREICRYLKWMEQAEVIWQLKKKSPPLTFWYVHQLLHVDKLFKHLFTADCMLNDLGYLQFHRLSHYEELLQGIRHFDPSESALMRVLNLGIAHHYLYTKNAELYSSLHQVFDQCKEQMAQPTGFIAVSHLQRKRKRAFEDLSQMAAKGISLFKSYLPFTLQRLKHLAQEAQPALRA